MNQDEYWNDEEVVKEFAEYSYREYWKGFLASFKNPGELKLLDLGCGGGRHSELALSMGFETYACDAHEGMVQATQKKFVAAGLTGEEAGKKVIVAGFMDLPYSSNEFDIVIAAGVFHNGDKTEMIHEGIKQTARIIKPEGYLALNVFIAGDATDGLTPTEDNNIYINGAGLPMILLQKEEILKILHENELHAVGEISIYKSKISEGERNVLRGIFQKQS